LATYAKSSGQDFIPVHIYPVRFNVKKSADYLGKYVRDFADYAHLANSMKEVFYYFEKYRKLPVIMVNNRGSYVLDQEWEYSLLLHNCREYRYHHRVEWHHSNTDPMHWDNSSPAKDDKHYAD
jgi:hypothetical protein